MFRKISHVWRYRKFLYIISFQTTLFHILNCINLVGFHSIWTTFWRGRANNWIWSRTSNIDCCWPAVWIVYVYNVWRRRTTYVLVNSLCSILSSVKYFPKDISYARIMFLKYPVHVCVVKKDTGFSKCRISQTRTAPWSPWSNEFIRYYWIYAGNTTSALIGQRVHEY